MRNPQRLLPTLARPALVLLATCALGQAQLVHRYSFSDSGTQVMDSIGSAHGEALGGAVMTGSGGLILDGTDDYVALPSGLVSGMADITIEAWVTMQGSSIPNWARVFDFNETSGGAGSQGNGIHYLFLAASSSSQVPAAGIKLSTPSSIKVFATNGASTGVETYFAMVYSGSTDELSFYVDGVLQGTETVIDELTDLHDVNCWLGQSFSAADPHAAIEFNEFRVHNGAFNSAQIAVSFTGGADSIGVGSSYCGPAVPNSAGQSGTMLVAGSPIVADNAVALSALGLPANEFGMFLTGQTAGMVSGPNGSQGNLCVVAGIGLYRSPGQVQSTGASGTLAITIDLTATPVGATTVSVLAGETWNFQAWHRDTLPGTGPTSNFTDAVAVTFQ